MAEDFDERLNQVERALKVINTIGNNPDLQAAAFSHLFGTAAGTPKVDAPEAEEFSDTSTEEASGSGDSKKANGSKRPRKTPSVAQDKTLNIAPTGKKGWAEFWAEKKPATNNDKYVICVYWLLEVAELPKATIHQIVSLFIAAKWSLPKDPRNQTSQVSKAGWLDSKDQQDIKLTSMGTARVVNELPTK